MLRPATWPWRAASKRRMRPSSPSCASCIASALYRRHGVGLVAGPPSWVVQGRRPEPASESSTILSSTAMRIAVLSDLHSNLEALQAVLADLAAQGGADQTWCLGDIVGYGPDPAETLEFVRAKVDVAVAGNHDYAVAGVIDISEFKPLSRRGRPLDGPAALRAAAPVPERAPRQGRGLRHLHPGPRQPPPTYVGVPALPGGGPGQPERV
ncbi:MAG: metallophosphoesterase [Dehalococcoidia bacterium]|nr:metallophosphoesterase [Dehalococcoidia bacterium]